ncbi:hypothetical protein [Catellatospora methionotrophica]|uniref:hypothetical protein n=1 Tax=Catellatospora methionotrophica TaxID=121620 RepID=UPI0033EF8251
MIRRLCHTFLAGAARRWPADLRAEMLAEWRAELHALPGMTRRLRYAASLAVSRPHREPAVVVRPGRNVVHAVLSLALLAIVPVLYPGLVVRLSNLYSEDTIAWQVWVGVGGLVAAVVLGIICAGVTTGVTQLVRPVLVPLWTIGAAYAVMLAVLLAQGWHDRARLIDMSCWAASAVVLGALAAMAARAGRAALSWGVVATGVAVSWWFWYMHSTMSHFDALGMETFFGGRFLPAYAFVVGTDAMLHVNIFLFVYAQVLVLRHRVAPAPVAEASSGVVA